MLKLKNWLSSLLVLAITALPVMAGNDAKTDGNAANGTGAGATAAAASPAPSPAPSPSPSVGLGAATGDANVTALLGVLVMKGVLAPSEANAIRNASPAMQFQALVQVLAQKGVVSAADLAVAANPAPQPAAVAAAPEPENEGMSSSATVAEGSPQQTQPGPGQPVPSRVAGELPHIPPSVVTAVTPVRVFPVDAPKTGGLAGIKAGPITLAPYGFVKATVVHDSSDPDGDDFPFPGIWLNSGNILSTGPTKDPEVHVKARSTRFGLNLEWPDISKNITLTGKIEGDLEGNFSEVDNRDVTSIRSNMPQLRLAFVRLDWHASDHTDIFFVGGQDWTLFGSGALMNIVETTFNGAFWGNTYGRSPQMRGGFIQTLSQQHHVNLEGQGGIMMPSSGQILKLGSLELAGQLGQGEREGADSDRPEWEGRVALSYQLDPAPGVAPAQIALAGFRGSRTSIAYNLSAVGASAPYAEMCATTNYCTTFPNGFEASSHMWGGQIVAQIPTRWFTVVATAYKGGDLRFLLGGQLNTFATDVAGLDPASLEGPMPTLDGGPLLAAGGAVLGCPIGDFTPGVVGGTCSVAPVVAPQQPIRSFGGFVQLGLPLSRWFNADPKGHNAGWQLHFTVGKDQVVNRDLNNPGYVGAYNGGGTAPLPLLMGKTAIGTLYYKLNTWATFAFEQSVYASRGLDHANIYTIAGTSSNEWQDHRTEFGPIFTF
ncbi:MAG: hypothetical protein WBZ01_11010 [Terriglobales bacterium]|jgi:hypothetical protein